MGLPKPVVHRQHHPNGGQRLIAVFSTKESQQIVKNQVHSHSTTWKKDKQTTQPKSKSTIFSTKGKDNRLINTPSPLSLHYQEEGHTDHQIKVGIHHLKTRLILSPYNWIRLPKHIEPMKNEDQG